MMACLPKKFLIKVALVRTGTVFHYKNTCETLPASKPLKHLLLFFLLRAEGLCKGDCSPKETAQFRRVQGFVQFLPNPRIKEPGAFSSAAKKMERPRAAKKNSLRVSGVETDLRSTNLHHLNLHH